MGKSVYEQALANARRYDSNFDHMAEEYLQGEREGGILDELRVRLLDSGLSADVAGGCIDLLVGEWDDAMHYYQEPNGDWLCVDPASREHHLRLGNDATEGRATSIAGDVGSVCTTAVGAGFLKKCKRVTRSDVPAAWRRMLDGGD
jgi:hypothetical protein